MFYLESIYFLSTTVLLVVGAMQGFQLDVTDPQFLSIRKSRILRLALGMLSLLFLGGLWITAQGTRPADSVYLWWFFGPMFLGVSYFLAYLAGPQDVRIDLQARVCYGTKGWFFRPRQQTYQLTDASSLCACCGGQNCYVILRVGDSGNHRFVLATRGTKSQAYDAGKDFADKLRLPIKEMTLEEACRSR